ncbi:hypothetical protein QMU_3239, partial [Clostridioides difficile DA00310]
MLILIFLVSAYIINIFIRDVFYYKSLIAVQKFLFSYKF